MKFQEQKKPHENSRGEYDADMQRRRRCFLKILLETAEAMERDPRTYAQFRALTKRKT